MVQWSGHPPIGEMAAAGVCYRCGGKRYDREELLCDACLEWRRSDAAVIEYMEEWPRRMAAFLREQAGEEYVQELLEAFRDYAVGDDRLGEDFYRWVMQG